MDFRLTYKVSVFSEDNTAVIIEGGPSSLDALDDVRSSDAVEVRLDQDGAQQYLVTEIFLGNFVEGAVVVHVFPVRCEGFKAELAGGCVLVSDGVVVAGLLDGRRQAKELFRVVGLDGGLVLGIRHKHWYILIGEELVGGGWVQEVKRERSMVITYSYQDR